MNKTLSSRCSSGEKVAKQETITILCGHGSEADRLGSSRYLGEEAFHLAWGSREVWQAV